MNDEKNISGEKRKLALRIVWLAAIAFIIAASFFLFRGKIGTPPSTDAGLAQDSDGRRHQWPKFYHADSGRWTIFDEATHILKERKFVSGPTERDAYTVYVLPRGGRVVTLEGKGRWKRVQALAPDGSVEAEGWIDAHTIREAEESE